MTGMEVALWIAGTASYPTVADVRAGMVRPTGRICLHAIRNGRAVQTEPVDAATVDWTRLLPTDRVEMLP